MSCVHRQHIVSLLHKSPRQAVVPSPGAADPALGRGKVLVSEGSLHSGACKHGGRYPVEAGTEAWGMATPSSSGEVHIAEVQQSGSEPVQPGGDDSLSALVRCHTSCSSGTVCHGTDVAEAVTVCLSSDSSDPGSSSKGLPGLNPPSPSGSVLASSGMVLGPDISSRQHSMGDPGSERSVSSAGDVLKW